MSKNYPDDIRSYDHHPSSPFHSQVFNTCWDCWHRGTDACPRPESCEDDDDACESYEPDYI